MSSRLLAIEDRLAAAALLALAACALAPRARARQSLAPTLIGEPIAQPGGAFGEAIVATEEVLVAGQSGAPTPWGGSVEVYQRQGPTWAHQASIPAPDAHSPAFGYHLGLAPSGERILVGAPTSQAGGAALGRATVFEKVAGSWTQVAQLAPSDAGAGASALLFGLDFACTSERTFVRAPGWGGHASPEGPGAVYVYAHDSATAQVAEEGIVRPATFQAGLPWASSLDASGSTLVVGAMHYGALQGRVHVFAHQGGAWIQVQELAPSDPSDTLFGADVALHGSRLVVGAPGTQTGAAYVYELSEGAWVEVERIVPSDPCAGALFGDRVDVVGTTIAVGNGHYGSSWCGTTPYAGRVYVFDDVLGTTREIGRAEPLSLEGVGGSFGRFLALSKRSLLVGHGKFSGSCPPTSPACAAGIVYDFRLPSLLSGPDAVTTQGGTQLLQLSAGASQSGQVHLLLGSLSGTSPGLALEGEWLPLAPDDYFAVTLTQPNSAFLPDSLGSLDAQGRAVATFQLSSPLPSALAGLDIAHAYVLLRPWDGKIVWASNAHLLTL